MECFICEVKGERTKLFNAIVREGVVKICEDCSVKEGIPVIRSMTNLQLKESEKNQTVYEKLSKMAGLDPEEHKSKFGEKTERLRKQNEELRKIVDERKELSFPDLKQVKLDEREDLVRNYHWAIFSARRARRLTQAQLAEAISEPEASIKLVERGILPDNYVPFIRKIQTYLGVTVFNKPIKKELGFDEATSKSLTVSDIKEIEGKVEEESKSSFFPWRKKLSFLSKKKENKETEEVVDEDIEQLKEEEVSSVDVKEVERVLKSAEKEDASKEDEFFDKKEGFSKDDVDKIIFGNK